MADTSKGNPEKLAAAISKRFTSDQLEYMRKTGISADSFSRTAALGKLWLQSRIVTK